MKSKSEEDRNATWGGVNEQCLVWLHVPFTKGKRKQKVAAWFLWGNKHKQKGYETKHDFLFGVQILISCSIKGSMGGGGGVLCLLTVLSFATWSLVGRSRAPHILRTSSRACTCHCGCIARRMVVHVSRFDVVCLPAKKKLLHSSTMSSTVTLLLIEELVFEAWIISPNKSFGPFCCSTLSFPFPFLRSISFTSDFLISLSSFQDFIFLLVGKNL